MKVEVINFGSFNPLWQVGQLLFVVQESTPIVDFIQMLLQILPEHAGSEQS